MSSLFILHLKLFQEFSFQRQRMDLKMKEDKNFSGAFNKTRNIQVVKFNFLNLNFFYC